MGSKQKKSQSRNLADLDPSTGIPKDKLHYYSPQHLSLIAMGRKLREAKELRQMLVKCEEDLVREGCSTIAAKGHEVLITHDPKVYEKDLKKMKKASRIVYLYCDKNLNLLDLAPLLPFVSPERLAEYERLNQAYDDLLSD